MKKPSRPGASPAYQKSFTVEELLACKQNPIEIEPEPQTQDEIARSLGIEALSDLSATLSVREEGDLVHVLGQVRAKVTQICTVTLEPFAADLSEDVDVYFSENPSADASEPTPGNDADWEDPPDAIIAGQIDLGQLVVEHVALGLDPYPRKPGAQFDAGTDVAGGKESESPFAVLNKLKKEENS